MVVQKALSAGVDVQGMREEPQVLGMRVEPFLAADGEKAGQLWPLTRQQGLSMGDRACLSLGPRWPGRPQADRRSFQLDPERWEVFVAALDAPPQLHPRLARLPREPSAVERSVMEEPPAGGAG